MPRIVGTAASRCSLAFLHSFLPLSIPRIHFFDPGTNLQHWNPRGFLPSHIGFVSTTDGALVPLKFGFVVLLCFGFVGFGFSFCGLASLFILPVKYINI